MAALTDVHQRQQLHSPAERLLARLFDRLWEQYRARVPHVQVYEQLVADAGGTFFNDHIAFRTLATQRGGTGIATLSRPFEALGYQAAGCYAFPDKKLAALHFQHANPRLPKLFVSELQTWELPRVARQAVVEALGTPAPAVGDDLLAELASVGARTATEAPDQDRLVTQVLASFDRPWAPPPRAVVEQVDGASQYAAWVLVHGHAVNHFTALINSHGIESLDSIDKTAAALADAGVPMKAEVEGEPGSKLRQTATAAAVRDDVPFAGGPGEWTYAYFELAERGEVAGPDGAPTRFEGFLGAQATHLFEMTKR